MAIRHSSGVSSLRAGPLQSGVVRRTSAVLVATALAFLFAACSEARQEPPELGPALERVVDAGAPGAFVAVRTGTTTVTEARGLAQSEPAVPMRSDARFRIGSITKSFVAALVLLLVDDGRLTLDDTVERWLPGLVPGGESITIRQLLRHTSGLFDYVEDERVFQQRERRWRPTELVGLAVGHAPSTRGRFAYSSTNYVLLGLVAEKAGRAPLGQQLERRLFRLLRLRSTSFVPGKVRGDHVHGHRPPTHQGIVTGLPADTSREPAWWAWSAGAMVSTASDLQTFFGALLRGELLGPALMRELDEVVPAGRQQYGLGLATFPTPCGEAWGHTGNVQGTIAVAWSTRDATRQLVLVVNTYPLSAELEAAVRELQDAAFCHGA